MSDSCLITAIVSILIIKGYLKTLSAHKISSRN